MKTYSGNGLKIMGSAIGGGKMSDYTAIIHCEKCHRELAKIRAYHVPDPLRFVPQDIMTEKYALNSMFCQNCLNGKSEEPNGN